MLRRRGWKWFLMAGILVMGAHAPLFSEPRAVIEVNVVDGKTKKAFPNVKVSGIFEDDSGNKMSLAEKNSDARGQYIDFVKVNGKFIITVSAPGYQTEKVEGEVKGTDVRVSRRVRSTIVLKKEVPVPPVTAVKEKEVTKEAEEPAKKTEAAPVAAKPEEKAEVKGPAVTSKIEPMAFEEILTETGWDVSRLHQVVLESLLYGDVRFGYVTRKLCEATAPYLESFLKGILDNAKDYVLSENFLQDYLQKRSDLFNIKSDVEDKNVPLSAKELIRKRLEWFMEESSTVDFKAETKSTECWAAVFVNEEYEQKSKIWKKCYRAGPQLTKIARDFAAELLDTLKK